MTQTLQPTAEPLECPECAAAITARPTLAGEVLDCTGCSAELEVVSLQPLLVQLAPGVEEDWGE
ncbi:MAG TPA: lysine biosynthesis protein LysW [Candidatus Thermoplasmatota archaeon]|nr:lysine biosynthesis protein LysW [Candidatus Thermoplasmatota archaeon]